MGEMIEKTKGKLKQAAAALTGDKNLKKEGETDEAKGQLEGMAKDLKHAVKDVKSAVTQALK